MMNHEHSEHHNGHEDQPDLHGMLIVGEETIFLSHLPMFGHPHHDFQVILEVTFTKPESDPQAIYVNDRQTHSEIKIYTLAPENFVLADLVSSDPAHPPLRSFKGTIVRGHFEKGGTPIIGDVQVNVTNVIHFRQFDPDVEALSQLEYLLFGKGDELFLAHLITRPPDFDQTLSVQLPNHPFSAEALSRGIRVRIPERANSIPQRLKETQQVDGALQFTLEANREFYFEEGELRSPATFRQTEEEKAAGF